MQRITSSLVATVLILISTTTTLVSSFQIKTASLPADLPSIQDCRRSAYAGKPVNLASAVSFCNADQIQKENYICIIAKSNDGMVLGTADLNTRVSIIYYMHLPLNDTIMSIFYNTLTINIISYIRHNYYFNNNWTMQRRR